MFEFKGNLNIQAILQLTEHIYNSRKHRSIGTTPIRAHHCSHTSSILARKLLQTHNKKQKRLRNIFSLKKDYLYKIGDKVLLKNKRTPFQKSNPLKNPEFSPIITTITKIDRRFLPYSYTISTHPNKKFYFFELHRVSDQYKNDIKQQQQQQQTPFQNPSKIIVQDFSYENPPVLRSGKSLNKKKLLYYKVQRGDKEEKITDNTLKFYKKLFGNNSLEYSQIFQQKPELII